MAPERWLSCLPGVPIIWERPHPQVPSAVDRTGNLWVDPSLTIVELRCAIAHEAVHLERGHSGCQPRKIERDVRREAARRLVPLDDLTNAVRWACTLEELANELEVTDMVLEDRLHHLTDDEREQLAAAITHH